MFVVNTYIASYGFGSIISGLLGWGFYQINNPSVTFYSWQLLFIIIAAISIILGGVVGIFLPDSPPRAKWQVHRSGSNALRISFSEADKVLMVERVRANDQGIKNKQWNWDQLREGVADVYVWSFVLIALLK